MLIQFILRMELWTFFIRWIYAGTLPSEGLRRQTYNVAKTSCVFFLCQITELTVIYLTPTYLRGISVSIIFNDRNIFNHIL